MVNHNGAAFAPASELTFFRIRAFMNMVTILVPVAIIALVLIGFFVVRSRRQERRARDAGMTALTTKPLNIHELVALLAEYIPEK